MIISIYLLYFYCIINILILAGVKDTIVSTGSVKKLINLLRAADLKIKEAAAIVLCNLSADGMVK